MDKLFSIVDQEEYRQTVDILLDEFNSKKMFPKLPIEITPMDYKQLARETKEVLTSSNFSEAELREKLSHYDAEKLNYFIQTMNNKKVKLLQGSVREHNSAEGCLVTEFNWKTNLVVGTSTAANLQYPVLELDVQTVKKTNDEELLRNPTYEFTKNEVEKLIRALEKAF